MGKGKEQRKYSLTPSLSSSYSDSIKYYPTGGQIKTGEYGSQLRTPSPTSSQKRRQRSPTPDSGRRTKERSPTPESTRKHESGQITPKDAQSLSKMHPLDPRASGTKKIVINSPLVLSSSSQYTHGHSGRSSSTLTPITAMLLENDMAYKERTGHSPPPYQSHSDTRSYDFLGGYASSPGSIQQQLLHDTASSRSPSPRGLQRSQASAGQSVPHSSHGGHTEAPAPASSAQSVHNSGSFSTQSHTVPRSSLRREGTTSPPEPSNSSSSREGSSPHPDAAIASPTHSGHSVGSIKSSKRSGSH
ncbi:hypothetical protein L7F22_052889 [Adiantum nelumboides]|nr:hypothetical protein [Adiantum nelumboides]